MKKLAILASLLICGFIAAESFNGLTLETLNKDLPQEATYADWESVCWSYNIDPDYYEYIRFMEEYSGRCDFDNPEYNDSVEYALALFD